MRRRTTFLTILIVLALLTAGCGSSSGGSAHARVADAGATTMEAGSARMWMSTTMSGLPVGDMSFEGEGVMDFGAKRGRMELDLGPLLASQGVEDVDGTMESIFDGNVVYLRSPFLTAMIPGGKPWMKLDLQELAESEAGADLSQLQQFTGNDPTQSFAFLEAVAEDGVEKLGEEDVRGEATTHYRARVNLRRAYEEADAITDAERFEQLMDSLGMEEIDVDAWLDGDGRLRRMSFDQPLPTQAGAGTSTLVFELFGFGVDVEVDLPPEGDTVDFLDLMAQLEGTGG